MQKLYFILLLLLSSCVALACEVSRLHIRLADDRPFTIVTDDRYHKVPSNAFVVDLLPGTHFIQVRTMVNHVLCSGIINIPANTDIFALANGGGIDIIDLVPKNMGSCSSGCVHAEEVAVNARFFSFKRRLSGMVSVQQRFLQSKRFIASERVNAAQVAELMDIFPVEKQKMELALFALDHIVDQQNVEILEEALLLNSSKKEFRMVIERKRDGSLVE